MLLSLCPDLGARFRVALSIWVAGSIGMFISSQNCFSQNQAPLIKLASPDSQIQIEVQLGSEVESSSPLWSLRFKGRRLFEECGFGLQTQTEGDLLKGAHFLRQQVRWVDQYIVVPFGRADHADDRFREIRLSWSGKAGLAIDVVLRCYNDAFAFRYEVSGPDPGNTRVITEESTSFRAIGNPTAYAQILENFQTSHEHSVTPTNYASLSPGALLDLPLTLQWSQGTTVAITEAALRHYAGMALGTSERSHSKSPELRCRLSPGSDGTLVKTKLPFQTPWRVVLIGDRAGALLESQTIFCLNSPSMIPDTTWIHPGKITFHWWNGDVFDGTPGPRMLSFEMNKAYIDFCASSGIPTHSITSTEGITSPWYFQTKQGVAPGPDTDVTRPRPDFDLATIKQYADSKGIRLWTWVHQAALRGRVEEAFSAFEKMGWKGMMVDFFDHDDQEHVEFAEQILEAAARHHILIHLHGVWKPTGLERTYPNLMNHEGALNLEYLKWSQRCTPEHDLMMAFTRLVAGPMDYHLGGFRAVSRAQFQPRSIAPHVLGTRGHQLAMYVCFDNPNPMIADYPKAYENQVGFEFLQTVPTWWDETRILLANVGKLLVTARRKGETWYLGGLSAGPQRTLRIPIQVLGKGRMSARVWQDAPDSDSFPNHLQVETHSLENTDVLRVQVGKDGGFVAELKPENSKR